MNKNKKWFSLVIAMWLVIVITLLAFTILEYVVPFSRDIKWVENSSVAYYQANSWIEEGLYAVYDRNSNWTDSRTEYSQNIIVWNVSHTFDTSSSWSIIPPIWEWNSEYDKDWNTISSWNPIQLVVWDNYITNWSNVKIAFRVPDLDRTWINDYTLSGTTLAIVNWQLSSETNTINASSTLWNNWIIRVWDILDSDEIFDDSILDIQFLQWIDLNWLETNDEKIWKFYDDNCWVGKSCTLKFSIVNKIETTDWITLPYLEWQLKTWTNVIPDRYSKITTTWKSFGFKKDITIKVPSQTVNEAFDFTVFQ